MDDLDVVGVEDPVSTVIRRNEVRRRSGESQIRGLTRFGAPGATLANSGQIFGLTRFGAPGATLAESGQVFGNVGSGSGSSGILARFGAVSGGILKRF